jgi:hypothetical protein
MNDDVEITNDVATEIAAVQKKDRSTVKADAELMHSLMKHPGWGRYMTMIEAVGQNFHALAMKPLENLLEVGRAEHAKGTLNGLSLAAQLPSAKIREAADLNPAADVER